MKRDYKAEYRRRIAKAEAEGFSRSQSRGHPRIPTVILGAPTWALRAIEKRWQPSVSEKRAGRLSARSMEFFRAINLEIRSRGEEVALLWEMDLAWWEYSHDERDYFYGY